jgi:hypothetical protein
MEIAIPAIRRGKKVAAETIGLQIPPTETGDAPIFGFKVHWPF